MIVYCWSFFKQKTSYEMRISDLSSDVCSSDLLSTLFSFTRAYFLVDMEAPAAYVHFLTTLLPRKPKAELYSAIGLQKQGKTLFYRDFLHHLAHSHDAFDAAAGRSEEHTSELQSLMRISYAVFCLKKKKQ